MAKAIKQEMRFCTKCGRQTLHQGIVEQIRWLIHFVLMFVGGLGFLTLAWALLSKTLSSTGKVMTKDLTGKNLTGMYCSVCGNAEFR
jgi:hypothetical protein